MTEQIVEYLSGMKWPRARLANSNKNAKKKKKFFTLGQVLQITKGYRLSTMTKKHPQLAIMINTWMRKERPSFDYTSISVNQGVSLLHIDKMNCGPSMIVGLGDYEGGRLWSWGYKRHRLHDIKNKVMLIDSNLPHMTSPVSRGTRYSLVFFNMRAQDNPMPTEEYRMAMNLKFPAPPNSLDCTLRDRIPMDVAAEYVKNKFSFKQSDVGDYKSAAVPGNYGMVSRRFLVSR